MAVLLSAGFSERQAVSKAPRNRTGVIFGCLCTGDMAFIDSFGYMHAVAMLPVGQFDIAYH